MHISSSFCQHSFVEKDSRGNTVPLYFTFQFHTKTHKIRKKMIWWNVFEMLSLEHFSNGNNRTYETKIVWSFCISISVFKTGEVETNAKIMHHKAFHLNNMECFIYISFIHIKLTIVYNIICILFRKKLLDACVASVLLLHLLYSLLYKIITKSAEVLRRKCMVEKKTKENVYGKHDWFPPGREYCFVAFWHIVLIRNSLSDKENHTYA